MSSSDYPSRSDYKFGISWIVYAIVLVFVAIMLCTWLWMTSAPSRVAAKTLGTDNIIANYEWFYDTNAAYQARLGMIKSHAGLIKTEEDKAERSRLNIELSGMRQSCRDLASHYNANSEKANRSLFKSKNLPEELSLTACDA